MLAEADHTTQPALSAVAAAERALATAATPLNPAAVVDQPSRSSIRHAVEMARLAELSAAARSPSLARKIKRAMTQKLITQEVSLRHDKADQHARDLGRSGQDDTAADLAADELQDAFNASFAVLNDVACEVLDAPIAGPKDALIRVEAYAQIIGCQYDKEGRWYLDCDEDVSTVSDSMHAALRELANREPERQAWDDAVARYRKAADDLDVLFLQEDAVEQGKAVLDEVASSALNTGVRAGYRNRSEARDALLSMVPPDVGGLLVQLEAVADVGLMTDVSTFERRASLMVDGKALTTARLEEEDGTERIGLALIATNAARLRDRDMPSDWVALMERITWMHPNGYDAARLAYDRGMDSADFSGIHLSGSDQSKLPILTFGKAPADFFMVSPKACWQWSPAK